MYLDPARDSPHPDQLCLDAAGAFELPVFVEGARLFIEDRLFSAQRPGSEEVCRILEWARAVRNVGPESAEAAAHGYRLYDLARAYDGPRLAGALSTFAEL